VLQAAIRERLLACGLKLNEEKTRIVYCKDDYRKGNHEGVTFDFLGYQFRPGRAKGKRGKLFVSFLPGISPKAKNHIRDEMRAWRLKGSVPL
jgi:hypothetical protein